MRRKGGRGEWGVHKRTSLLFGNGHFPLPGSVLLLWHALCFPVHDYFFDKHEKESFICSLDVAPVRCLRAE